MQEHRILQDQQATRFQKGGRLQQHAGSSVIVADTGKNPHQTDGIKTLLSLKLENVGDSELDIANTQTLCALARLSNKFLANVECQYVCNLLCKQKAELAISATDIQQPCVTLQQGENILQQVLALPLVELLRPNLPSFAGAPELSSDISLILLTHVVPTG